MANQSGYVGNLGGYGGDGPLSGGIVTCKRWSGALL
jgi:hypothetical protein